MRTRSRTKTLLVSAALSLGLAAPACAQDARGFDVAATITACGGEGLTIAAEIAPAAGARNERAAARAVKAVRGASLRLRFEAAPLYGRTRRSRQVDLGRTTTARRFERFADLRAQSYAGVVRYRWVRGSRTVVSGIVRTRKTRAAGRRGRAFCSLRVGKPPTDTQPPVIFALPGDSAWKRGPLNVYLWAADDLSGVALVVSRLDAGPYAVGRNVRIATEGAHRLVYVARDKAGNQSAPGAVTLRVDMHAPTEPAITAPSGPTNDTTPEIRWSAATDSASGVQGYFVLVRSSSGAIVWSQSVASAGTLAVTVGQALAPGQYTAEVVAADAVGFTSKSISSFAVVAPSSANTDSDNDGHPDSADNCPFAANADQADNEADGAGDVCDTDDDNDGVADSQPDNCPTLDNPNQANADGDAQGDACDSDDDNDTRLDASDNCPTVANQAQTNSDTDALGDACDSDDDNDGLTDAQEAANNPPTSPTNPDTDADGLGDATDACPTVKPTIDVNHDGCQG